MFSQFFDKQNCRQKYFEFKPTKSQTPRNLLKNITNKQSKENQQTSISPNNRSNTSINVSQFFNKKKCYTPGNNQIVKTQQSGCLHRPNDQTKNSPNFAQNKAQAQKLKKISIQNSLNINHCHDERNFNDRHMAKDSQALKMHRQQSGAKSTKNSYNQQQMSQYLKKKVCINMPHISPTPSSKNMLDSSSLNKSLSSLNRKKFSPLNSLNNFCERKQSRSPHSKVDSGNFQTKKQCLRDQKTITRQTTSQDLLQGKKQKEKLILNYSKANDEKSCLEILNNLNENFFADVNIRDENQWSPLHFACLNGNIQIVSMLLYKEADIDSQTNSKITPLMISSQKGYEEITNLLINAGSDINLTDIFDNTALHYASLNGHNSIIQLLLSKPSINIFQKNQQSKTAMDLCSNESVMQLFHQKIYFINQTQQKSNKIYIHSAQDPKQRNQKMNSHKLSSKVLLKESSEYKIGNQSSNLDKKRREPILKRQSSATTNKKQKQNSTSRQTITTSDKSSKNSLNQSSSQNASQLIQTIESEQEKIGPHSFYVHGLLGKGSFGEVYLVEKRNSKQLFAMKILDKSKIMKHNLTKYAMTERNVLSVTNHAFIVKLNYAFQTSEKLFLLLDFCPGGDLGQHLQKEKKFSEEKTKMYLMEIILALEDLHKRDIIFRDLKPENIVLDQNGHAMLTDFGLSKEGVLDHADGARSFCGSVAYLAPEMLKRQGHGKAVDWYLLGVVAYEMLVGIPPYYANNREQLFLNIEKAPLKIPTYVSPDFKSLLKSLLQRNPAKRLGSGKGDADEIKSHKLFKGVSWEDVLNRKLKVPKPDYKIKLNNQSVDKIFEDSIISQESNNYVPGWSFAINQ